MKKNSILLLSIAIFFLTINSCIVKEKGKPLPGKIAFSNFLDSSYLIFENSDTAKLKFKIKKNREVHYGGYSWLSNKDIFLGVESIPGTKRGDYKSNVALFDLSGKIIERIYKTEMGETVGSIYASRKDKRVLFTKDTVGDLTVNPLEGLMRIQSIMVIDLQSRKVITKIKNAGAIPNLQICESPWIYDENRFVYSLTTGNEILNKGKSINPIDEKTIGIYIYDLTTDTKELLIPRGSFAVASPTNNQIAYLKDKTIMLMNLSNKNTEVIYEIGSKERVSNIHFTPDGKYIYLVHYNYYFFNSFTSGEKLIEISTGKEINFKRIGQGFGNYTWK